MPASAVHAQTPTTGPAQLSIGTKFVKDFCLEGRADGTLVINKCNAQPPQAIDYDDTTGQIKTAGKCVSAHTKGQPLALADCADATEQFWTFEANGTLKSDSGLCADVLNFNKDPGTAVIAWDCTATENQSFFLTNIRVAKAEKTGPALADISREVNGTPSIASYFVQGLCLQATGSKGAISIEVCSRAAGQDFRFKAGNSGAIIQGDMCLTSTGQGNALELAACNGKPEQAWTFTVEGLLRTGTNLCADILGFGTRPGTGVIAWECTATDNQRWYPAVATKSGSFTLGATIGDQLRGGGVTTLSLTPSFSGGNLTAAGGKILSADTDGKVTGGEKDTIVVGGAGVLTQRFAKGLVAPTVKDATTAGGTSLLPGDWSFFSGSTAGTMKLD
ncbi:ricin-type beta-trefoil lectin domain protein [Asticcacaulis biprosthecium C19]|uniref:Ricin-type beta-trefoil lectin domain protein n=2 Tax=Asticcacaulis biprosthecium TaxID=76891 RepID=F4QSW1_9CAUL|nr:ricin-type beta-trefoil lectin domain protein [Asticcacaulis biprosthecium C19]